MKWTQIPDVGGWWFFTRDLKNWRLAKPTFVAMADEKGKPGVFTAAPTVKFTVTKSMGWWYGPLKLDVPDPALSVKGT